jgi:hypothetical protein
MKFATIVVAIAALVTGTAVASAAGVSKKTPGHQMQLKGSVQGSPGASGYAPGHRMQANRTQARRSAPGASGYAPGHSTTTGSGNTPR